MLDKWRINRKSIRPKKTKTEDEKNGSDQASKTVTLEDIKRELSGSDDISYREIKINENETLTLCFVQGMVDVVLIDEEIIKPIILQINKNQNIKVKEIYTRIEDGLIYHATYKIEEDLDKVIDAILGGELFLISEGMKKGILFEVKGAEKRSIQEPSDENVLKGPKDSFIEVLRVNTSLIRKRMKTKELKIEEYEIGSEGKTKIAIIYMNNVIDKNLLSQVREKAKQIKVDNIVFPGDFDEQMTDSKTIFPQVIYTERPDKLCANINDGRIAIIIDGLPTAYIVPVEFPMFFQAPEDYSFNTIIASFLRTLRYICMVLGVFLPAFYMAVMTFHREMIPTELAISIIKSKEGVPFTAFLETLFMLIAFEILTEAGVRLPKVIGQTASVVGGLIVGQAAVQAKIVSPAAVIIVAIAVISGYVLPSQDFNNAVRIIRIGMFMLAYIAGLFGISMGLIILLYHLCSLKNFGIPYMVPFTSNEGKSILADTFIRPPIFKKGKGK